MTLQTFKRIDSAKNYQHFEVEVALYDLKNFFQEVKLGFPYNQFYYFC